MNFMDTRYAVRTCILSRRWKDLWKRLTSLSFFQPDFIRLTSFNKFVSRVLSGRDGSISLLNLRFWGLGPTDSELLNMAMRYAALQNVQQLTIQIPFDPINTPHCFDPLIFSCPSLTSLMLYKLSSDPPLELPKSLQLPALKSLFLANVNFTATDNGCAEPFSTCNLLNILVLKKCSLHKDAKVLFISNSNLSSLNLEDLNNLDTYQHKIVLATPNLSSLTIINYLGFSYQPLSSTCNLSCLEEGTIHTTTNISHSVFISWLQALTNVKKLTLSSSTVKIIPKDLSNFATMRTQPPCFVRLESLKVKMNTYVKISDEEVNRAVEYLLQNCPLIRVAVIKC